ncbi:MAG: GspE/PulE family protein [Patescibacteria group bacterium]|jgi:type IV pilus assembly protein PilB
MAVNDKKLLAVLRESELLTPDQLERAEAEAQRAHLTLADILVRNEYVSDEHLGQIIADLFDVPFIRLANTPIDEKTLRLIPEIVARNQSIIAYQWDDEGVRIAMNNPDNVEIVELLKKRLGAPIQASYATAEDIKEALRHYRKNIQEEFSDILKRHVEQADKAQAEDAPIIAIVDMLISYAYENRASDIHLEPHDQTLVVRYRIDGVLHDVADIPKRLQEPMVSRIKIVSSLRTDEHQAAQDGRFQKNIDGEKVDVRVSIVPISEGEKVVMRLLSQGTRRFSLEELGMESRDLAVIQDALKKPHGMILATGPTGSGKTTTLYAMLKILNTRTVNISTIEDPVEYDIEGINQIQVNTGTNLTFTDGLRSILRQDPDIIMVGEVRDQDTAKIAINAATTGHLVLSSLHTNDATTTFPRLLDMGIEPFLIASTINVVIAQRLVRRIHRGCIESYVPTQIELAHIQRILGEKEMQMHNIKRKGARLYRGKGCDVCHGTGFEGRIGIFEVLHMNEHVRSLVMARSNAEDIRSAAMSEGMTTMFTDGMQKVLQGATTLEEVMRVTKE